MPVYFQIGANANVASDYAVTKYIPEWLVFVVKIARCNIYDSSATGP